MTKISKQELQKAKITSFLEGMLYKTATNTVRYFIAQLRDYVSRKEELPIDTLKTSLISSRNSLKIYNSLHRKALKDYHWGKLWERQLSEMNRQMRELNKEFGELYRPLKQHVYSKRAEKSD